MTDALRLSTKSKALFSQPENYIEKVYAGWLGKIIGVRHGGNIEGWTYQKIKRTFGEITHYLHEFKNFAADDDTNGPMFFLRSLEDFTYTSDITPEQIGLTWLNYAPDNHGFYWWGGYGKSTEHTAYLNLKNGMMAPRSGSIEQNGAEVAEQIGGQIFIDVWGLIAPGNPRLAAQYAEKAASVSHDGNGKFGGMFIAACIAEAFNEKDIEKIIEAGLSVIPEDSMYVKMSKDVINFYKKYPDNWRDCFQFVYEHYGYDKYPGNCHIIPNSAVIVLSLLYSKGDFDQGINICNMCGWDTDCNVGNVGTILGVKNGLEGIDYSWRKPINDFLCCSSVIGTLNILDIPWCASYIANLGYKIQGETVPEGWEDILERRGPKFHFEYPGSTHAFRFDYDENSHLTCKGINVDKVSFNGRRSLKVLFDRTNGGNGYRVYHKSYYRPDDFNDSRYDPSFSPLIYPGQTVEAIVKLDQSINTKVFARLYVKDGNANVRHYGEKEEVTKETWKLLKYDIPSLKNVCLEEIGVEFIPVEGWNKELIAYIDSIDFKGKPDYEISFSKERMEIWHGLHKEVSQLTYLRGIWALEDGELSGSYYGEPAESYTGDLNWDDYIYEVSIAPKLGSYHNILFRVQGGIRSYAVGLSPNNKISLYKNENKYKELISGDFDWGIGNIYKIVVEAKKNHFKVFVDDQFILEYTDEESPYLTGQVGFSNFDGSHTHYKSFSVKGIY